MALTVVAGAPPMGGQSMEDALRQIASLAPARSRVSLVVENRTGLADVAERFRSALVERLAAGSSELAEDGAPLRVVLGRNVRGLVAAGQFGGKSVVTAWRQDASSLPGAQARLGTTRVWMGSEPVLDLRVDSNGESMLILEPSRISLYRRRGDSWRFDQATPLLLSSPMPRDPRGNIKGSLESFRIFTPSGTCSGSAVPALTLSCGEANTANSWVSGRNHQHDAALGEYFSSATTFDGRTVYSPLAGGVRITGVPAPLADFGSELAATDGACGVTWIGVRDGNLLAGMSSTGEPVTVPMPMNGEIQTMSNTGLGDAVHVVVLRPEARTYEIHRVAINCAE